jgi:hypothetical protein
MKQDPPKQEIKDFYTRAIKRELAEINRLKNSITPEEILWSTALNTEPSYCHTIYTSIWNLMAQQTHAGVLAKPKASSDSQIDTAMRVYAAWMTLVEFLPREDVTADSPVNDLSFNSYVAAYARGLLQTSHDLSLIVDMLRQVMDDQRRP